jgi:hypothetical protein
MERKGRAELGFAAAVKLSQQRKEGMQRIARSVRCEVAPVEGDKAWPFVLAVSLTFLT